MESKIIVKWKKKNLSLGNLSVYWDQISFELVILDYLKQTKNTGVYFLKSFQNYLLFY